MAPDGLSFIMYDEDYTTLGQFQSGLKTILFRLAYGT